MGIFFVAMAWAGGTGELTTTQAFPCQDGWVGCIQQDRVAGGFDEARGQSADLRVGWFDLDATSGFSPFQVLSPYDNPERASVHVAKAKVKAVLKKSAKVQPPRDLVLPVVPDVPVPDPDPESSVWNASRCGQVSLPVYEMDAMLGRLGADSKEWMNACVEGEAKQTTKDGISRLLIADAHARGDREAWRGLLRRHLEAIDQSDPDLCYTYALALTRAGDDWGVIRWSTVALENRTVWTGKTYVARVSSLYKLRASAAQRLWKGAEEALAQSPSEEAQGKARKARDLTKEYAREWHAYVHAAQLDPSLAFQLCVSASGNQAYCDVP